MQCSAIIVRREYHLTLGAILENLRLTNETKEVEELPSPRSWVVAPLYWGPDRIDAGCPGNLKRLPVSVSLSPSTFSTDMSWSMKLPT